MLQNLLQKDKKVISAAVYIFYIILEAIIQASISGVS